MINKLALLFCLFPFVLKVMNSDLQPWAFILIVFAMILASKTRLSHSWRILLAVALIIILYRLRFNYDLYDTFRSIPTYLTPVFLLLLFKSDFVSTDTLSKYIRIALVIYFAYGLMQKFGLDPLRFNDIRPAFDRGFRSLTPEPSMFGFISILLILSLLILKKATLFDWIVHTGNMLLGLSMSALLAGLPLIPILVFVSSRKQKLALIIAVLLWVTFYDGLSLFYTDRFSQLTSIPIQDLIVSDLSINERLGHLNYIFSQPLHYIFGGFNGWGIDYSDYIKSNPIFVEGSNINNILSGVGSILYDGGAFGIIYLYLLFRQWLECKGKLSPVDILILLTWLIVALQSVSFAVPLLSFPIGCLIFRDRHVFSSLGKPVIYKSPIHW